MPGPAATVTSMHVCPMVTGYIPHVGGPVSGPGVPTVLIGSKPAAVMGDMCVCVGPPDTIVQGEATVLIGGKPAATMGSMTAHGGSITVGEPTVLIGTGGSPATSVMPISKIPFPEIRMVDRIGAAMRGQSSSLKEAEANQEQIRQDAVAEESNGEPRIYNVRWIKEDKKISDSKELKQVKVKASVSGIKDGETVNFKINRKRIEDEEEQVIELSGTVADGEVEAIWDIEENEPNQE
ncbi:PAAR domain-containing protein [Saccharicrinis aurantiacus]|uniref:PAAR domain-containing protein n=1 Tax=Saccharicrinis aurantiacus TaxID=1849719 RepID=UPI00249272F1|nr:PAAR domain-containing protein [Saccharicrinis aurantiacus]